MGRRHDPAHRLPRPERHLFPGPGRVGHAAPHPDLRHHAAAGLRHGAAPRSRGGDCSAAGRMRRSARRALFQAALRSHRWWLQRARSGRLGPRGDPASLGKRQRQLAGLGRGARAACRPTTTTAIRRKDTGHVDAGHAPARRGLPALHPSRRPLPRLRLGSGAAMGGGALQDRRRADDRDPRPRDRRSASRWPRLSATEDGARELAAHASTGSRRDSPAAGGRSSPASSPSTSISGEDVEAPTQAGFMPLLALTPRRWRSARPSRRRSRAGATAWSSACPRRAPFSPAFEPKRYWRGPVWAVINWLIADGLRANGLDDLARRSSAARSGRSSAPASASISIRPPAKASAATRSPGPPPPIWCSAGEADRGSPVDIACDLWHEIVRPAFLAGRVH